jgi:putative hydrolase of the HAD superfamily
MPQIRWFIFDLGNVLVKLAYERVMEAICNDADCSRDELVQIMEEPGGYRDLERGDVTFDEFYAFMKERIGYRGSLHRFRAVWGNFFDGPIEGIEELLDRVRERYKVAFLSNSNEVHEVVIPEEFSVLFRKDDLFVFSHRFRTAKPDPEIYLQALNMIGAEAHEVVYVDDLLENVTAARNLGIRAYQFENSQALEMELEAEGLLPAASD